MRQRGDGCGGRRAARGHGYDPQRLGYREHSLKTQFGMLTLRIPKLRTGSHFPDSLIERWGVRGPRRHLRRLRDVPARCLDLQDRTCTGAHGAASLSKDRVSRTCGELDAEVAVRRYPYLWVDATCGEDGTRRVVSLSGRRCRELRQLEGVPAGAPRARARRRAVRDVGRLRRHCARGEGALSGRGVAVLRRAPRERCCRRGGDDV